MKNRAYKRHKNFSLIGMKGKSKNRISKFVSLSLKWGFITVVVLLFYIWHVIETQKLLLHVEELNKKRQEMKEYFEIKRIELLQSVSVQSIYERANKRGLSVHKPPDKVIIYTERE